MHHACAAPRPPKYLWDPDEPRLTRVQGPGSVDVSYTYDSAGRMLTRTSGGVTTRLEWDGWDCVKETTGSTVTRYIAPQGQIHSFERGGQVYQVHADAHNGSVRAITDSTGAVVAHYEYDAWGNQLGSSSPFAGGVAYGYCGSFGVRFDPASGLYYCRNRWYDSQLARWLSRDPKYQIGAYLYVENNPTRYIDYNGLEPWQPDLGSYVQGWGTNAEDFINWVSGVPQLTTYYGPGTPQVEFMRNAPGVDRARQLYYEQNRGRENPIPVINMPAKFGIPEFVDAGCNPAKHWVGSYHVYIYPGENNTVTVRLRNPTTRESFFRYTKFFIPFLSVPQEKRPGHMMANQWQEYKWTEPAPSDNSPFRPSYEMPTLDWGTRGGALY